MSLEVIIGNNQHATEIPESWLTALESVAHEAARLALENAAVDLVADGVIHNGDLESG